MLRLADLLTIAIRAGTGIFWQATGVLMSRED
jgi:hypothetical protein